MRSNRLLLAALVLFLASNVAGAGTLVKITSPDGRTVFSNVATDAAPTPPSPATASSTRAGVPPIAEKAILFATRTCNYCRQTREYLAQRGIAYIEHDIETESGKRAFDAAVGRPGVPVLSWRGVQIRGYDRQRYDQLFARR